MQVRGMTYVKQLFFLVGIERLIKKLYGLTWPLSIVKIRTIGVFLKIQLLFILFILIKESLMQIRDTNLLVRLHFLLETNLL